MFIREQPRSSRSHLEAGLHHLVEADERVSLMKSELELLQPEIHSKAQVRIRSHVCNPVVYSGAIEMRVPKAYIFCWYELISPLTNTNRTGAPGLQ